MYLDNFSFSFVHERVISYAKKTIIMIMMKMTSMTKTNKYRYATILFSVQNFEME